MHMLVLVETLTCLAYDVLLRCACGVSMIAQLLFII